MFLPQSSLFSPHPSSTQRRESAVLQDIRLNGDGSLQPLSPWSKIPCKNYLLS